MKLRNVLVLVGLVGAPLSAQSMTAEEVVQKHCVACHQAGLGGAPKLEDRAAWAPRITKGIDAMTATVLSGKGAMPPKGTCGTCDESALKAAVEVITAPYK